jgi:hypothetical protein
VKTATVDEKAGIAAKEPYRRVINLGNGVMFPVGSDEEAGFVEWMVEEAKAGRVTLPKSAPGPMERPAWLDTEPKMSSEEFWAFLENERADRF